MLSTILIASGPATYLAVWVIVLLIIFFTDLPKAAQYALIAYAIVPIGPIVQSGLGSLLYLFGM